MAKLRNRSILDRGWAADITGHFCFNPAASQDGETVYYPSAVCHTDVTVNIQPHLKSPERKAEAPHTQQNMLQLCDTQMANNMINTTNNDLSFSFCLHQTYLLLCTYLNGLLIDIGELVTHVPHSGAHTVWCNELGNERCQLNQHDK